jgi:lipopolysaccharide/colanic/teichoic acid biosynthesis glycosyltransferase
MPAVPDAASRLMRLQELALAAGLLLLAAPVMALIWLAIRLDSGRPVFFAQTREGLNGTPLIIHKFRTLDHDTPADAVTPEGDRHITRTGVLARRYRLDELPQLFDVIRGDLALVGPRPERAIDLRHVDERSKRALLQIRPGITGPVQLQFIGEDKVLAQVSDPERVYREVLVPAKVAANLEAFKTRSLWTDLSALAATLKTLCSPKARQASEQRLQQLLTRNIP